MCIEVLSSGLNTTLQDRGRLKFLDKGVPKSGFMDVTSAHMANALVNNPLNLAVLEMTLLGIKCKITQKITIAITGANMQPKLNGKPIAMYKAIKIPKDAILSFSGAKEGVYAYMAVLGGFQVPEVLESKSTYTPAKLGGFEGRSLKKGDVLSVLNQTLEPIYSKVKAPVFSSNVVLTCMPGPEWDDFSEESKHHFLNTTFTVTKNSNRIGIRLDGNKVMMPLKQEIISSGIVKGTVQITKGGQPIVMMADAPTTGGYLRLINLTNTSCDILAQVPVGGTVQFLLQKDNL